MAAAGLWVPVPVIRKLVWVTVWARSCALLPTPPTPHYTCTCPLPSCPPCRMLEVIVVSLLSPSGRKKAAKVLRDAASSMHRRRQ